MDNYIYLITLFPLLGFLVNGLLGRWLTERASGWIGSFAVLGSFIASGILFLDLLNHDPEQRLITQTLFTWMAAGKLHIDVVYWFDSLAAVMTLTITGVGLIIHVYSMGYMHGDPGFKRYFAYLNLFIFMMLNLVLADSLPVVFLGWEGVGLCSYLLIGFWFEDPAKASAGKKAFIVNRIGDFGFLVAMLMLFDQFGTLSISEIAGQAPGAMAGKGFFTAVTLLLFLGAVGKSAQIPLYVWLPDAMAGPTPVSALIHAATMVTAGVYLLVRNNVLFLLAPDTMLTVATVGVITAIYAAAIALTQHDIKKVLAYSTISQLGYMFTAIGVGAFTAGIFHLVTHAFFKALLFLGAGSVIHGLHGEQDMRKMGGLKVVMPETYWTMLVGALAIAGIPGLSGFFSKDEILWSAFSNPRGTEWIWLIGIITAGLTAFYIFRLIFRTFHGETRWDQSTPPHESPSNMTIPLILLAVLSAVGGFIGLPEILGGQNRLHHFLESTFRVPIPGMEVPAYSHTVEYILMAASVMVALGGVYYAYRLYVQYPSLPKVMADRVPRLYDLSSNKFYVDEIYDMALIQPIHRSSILLWHWMDNRVIDGIVNGAGRVVTIGSTLIRRIQTGLIQHYAAVVLAGVVSIICYLYLS